MTQPEIADGRGDGTVCSVDGAVVHVRRREAQDSVPAFEYVVGTEEGTPVAVQVRQPVPDGVEPERIGFPPACEDDWRLEDATLVFEAPVKPDQPVRTAWGVDLDEHPPIDPPSIDVVPLDQPEATRGSAAAGEADAGDASETDVGADEEDDTDRASGGDDTGEADDGEIPSTFDLSDPPEGLSDGGSPAATAGATDDSGASSGAAASTAGHDARATTRSPDGEAGESGTATTKPAADSTHDPATAEPLVAQLAAELRSGDVDEDHRSALRDALAVRLSDSTNAFVEHLQEKVERRTDRLSEEIESLEESVERVYGVKADASEIDAIKRGITELDDTKVGESDVRELQSDLSAAVERSERTAERVESLEDSTASAERVADLADAISAVREEVAALRDDVETLRATAATESALDERTEQLVETAGRLEDRIDQAATTEDVEDLRRSHRLDIDEAASEATSLRETLQDDYTDDAGIATEIDRRVTRSLATLVLFGIGAAGLLSTVLLAVQGSNRAVVTLVVGAAALLVWLGLLVRGDGSTVERLSSTGDRTG